MKKKIMTIGIILGVMLLGAIQFAFASESWSDAKRYDISAGDDWRVASSDGTAMVSEKTTDSSKYDVYTVTKSMWSSPRFKLVNSNNVAVSGEVETSPAGQYSTGSNNAGVIGYAYYGSVKPGWNQTGSDYIKLQMRIY